MEKLAFSLIMAAQKLRPYFQARTIVFQIKKPLWRVMNNPKASGRLVLRVIELGEFDIQYQSRTTIKVQALVDFIAEFTTREDEDEGLTAWMIWADGSSN